MQKLYSYIIAQDFGSAPNPFWGICTLVICKPRIRLLAQIGDWIAATGSKNSPIGDISGKLVYVMKITEKMSMREYDSYTKLKVPQKIPEWKNNDQRRRVGDSIYDYNYDPPNIRKSVHNETNRVRDLRGENALISDHFYYFGDNPIDLPKNLKGLVCKTHGQRSVSNNLYVEPFLKWLNGLNLILNKLYGKPSGRFFQNTLLKDLNDVSDKC